MPHPLAAALRRARLDAGLSQSEVARRAGVATKQTVSRWESGQQCPDLDFAQRWASAVGLTLTLVPYGNGKARP